MKNPTHNYSVGRDEQPRSQFVHDHPIQLSMGHGKTRRHISFTQEEALEVGLELIRLATTRRRSSKSDRDEIHEVVTDNPQNCTCTGNRLYAPCPPNCGRYKHYGPAADESHRETMRSLPCYLGASCRFCPKPEDK